MKKINIYELHGEMNKKRENRTKSLDFVLERCHNKIRNASKKELPRTLFDVPEFVIGLPVYNLNDCILHIMTSLNQNGFVVKYFFPKLLYISWDFDEINRNQNIALAKELVTYSEKQNHDLDKLRSVDRMLLTSRAQKVIDTTGSGDGVGGGHDEQAKTTKKGGSRVSYDSSNRFTEDYSVTYPSIDPRTNPSPRPKNVRNLPNGKFILNLD